jgi:Tol biopolymer transport system component
MLVALIPLPYAQAQDAYQQLVTQALSDLGRNCANQDSNSLCVGFDQADTTFFGATPDGYNSLAGDKTTLTDVASVRTYPINLANSTYGIAVMNVKTTNIPGAVDADAVFIALGDVEITNAVSPGDALVLGAPVGVNAIAQAELRVGPGANAKVLGTVANGALLLADGVSPDGEWVRVEFQQNVAWVNRAALDPAVDLSALPVIAASSLTPMQSFTFRTGSAAPPSLSVPPDVLVVQSPKTTPIDIWANGNHLRVEGVIFLRTLSDGRIQLITADGEATAFPDAPNEVGVSAGTSIIIGGGTWTDWTVLPVGWDEYDALIEIPGNIVTYTIILPDIIQPSAIVPQPPIYVVVPGQPEYIPISWREPHFEVVPVTYGEPGQDLERVAWEPFEIGCAGCTDLVLYQSDNDGDWDVYQLTGTGLSEPANNVSRGDGSQDLMPTYSADGAWAAFTTNRYILGGWEIQVARVDGSQEARVSFNSGNDVNPVWGPSNLLGWETNRHGQWDLYMIDVAGDGTPVRLTDDPANDINPYWFPEGGCDSPDAPQRLVFQSDRTGNWEIYELNVASGELTQLTDNDTEDEMPVLSRDGSKMAWLQLDDFGVYNLWMMDFATGATTQLTDLGVDAAGLMFSPDDSMVAFYASEEDDQEVYVVNLATGAVKWVTSNNAEDRAPTFRCDDPMMVIYHSDSLLNPELAGLRGVFESRVPADNSPVNPAQQLTQDLTADDIYPLSDAEERETKEGRKPPHP